MSEGTEALIAQEGFAGYGRWFRLLEIVAFKMDESDRCWVEYPAQKWCSLLGLKQKKLFSFLELTKNELKTKVVCYENKIRIEIPNLLKKRDKYTKDLQKKGKQLTPKKKIEEVDVEVDKDKTKRKGKIFDFNLVWEKYPLKDGKKNAERHFKATVKTEEDWEGINKALNNYLAHLKIETWKKPKNGSTWFNNWRDWTDWEEPESFDGEMTKEQKEEKSKKERLERERQAEINKQKFLKG